MQLLYFQDKYPFIDHLTFKTVFFLAEWMHGLKMQGPLKLKRLLLSEVVIGCQIYVYMCVNICVSLLTDVFGSPRLSAGS